ncbi:hypothetical protein HaLaN_07767 [Haematococcus lacustris]|uniref:Uncharacterized protein n=1 Tax=Haematococcus lacustris TaxID=44745 RepID=A0A699YZE7_HAELA|nr:hypothetical protein HaLaN_07767 [Haematococcus lacustris]
MHKPCADVAGDRRGGPQHIYQRKLAAALADLESTLAGSDAHGQHLSRLQQEERGKQGKTKTRTLLGTGC